jgi:hypothetical protein
MSQSKPSDQHESQGMVQAMFFSHIIPILAVTDWLDFGSGHAAHRRFEGIVK